jgi:hypothetical protein
MSTDTTSTNTTTQLVSVGIVSGTLGTELGGQVAVEFKWGNDPLIKIFTPPGHSINFTTILEKLFGKLGNSSTFYEKLGISNFIKDHFPQMELNLELFEYHLYEIQYDTPDLEKDGKEKKDSEGKTIYKTTKTLSVKSAKDLMNADKKKYTKATCLNNGGDYIIRVRTEKPWVLPDYPNFGLLSCAIDFSRKGDITTGSVSGIAGSLSGGQVAVKFVLDEKNPVLTILTPPGHPINLKSILESVFVDGLGSGKLQEFFSKTLKIPADFIKDLPDMELLIEKFEYHFYKISYDGPNEIQDPTDTSKKIKETLTKLMTKSIDDFTDTEKKTTYPNAKQLIPGGDFTIKIRSNSPWKIPHFDELEIINFAVEVSSSRGEAFKLIDTNPPTPLLTDK